eukprot:1161278-Pelagomonas_calceolata.AAC.5
MQVVLNLPAVMCTSLSPWHGCACSYLPHCAASLSTSMPWIIHSSSSSKPIGCLGTSSGTSAQFHKVVVGTDMPGGVAVEMH